MTLRSLACGLFLLTSLARADGPLITDRPDQAEAPYTVGAGRFQIESGVLYEQLKGGPDGVFTPTLLRIGTGETTELRVESDFLTLSQRTAGLSDASVGFKANLADQDWGAIAVLGRLNLPSGTGPFQGDSVTPELALLTAFPLGDSWSLAVSLQGGLPEDPVEGRHLQGFFATALGYQLHEQVGVFVEVFGSGPDGARGPFELAVDSGFTFLLNDDLQLDLAAARGLSGSGLDWSLTLGVSARY